MAALGAALVACCLGSALQSRGAPFSSVLVDPWGDYSLVSFPSGQGASPSLHSADRLVAVDGEALPRATGRFPAAWLAERVALAHQQGRQSLALTFSHLETPVVVATAIHPLADEDLWWLFGVYALLGMGFLWSALVLLRSARPLPSASVAYCFVALSSFALLVSLLDYHLARWAAAVFAVASTSLPFGLLGLALTFPQPLPGRLNSHLLPRLVLVCGTGASLTAGVVTALRLDVRALRLAVNAALPLALLVLSATVLWRWKVADAAQRRQLAPTLWGLVVTPLVLAASDVLGQRFDGGVLNVILPLTGLLVPASVGYSVLRTGALQARTIVTRRLLIPPLLLVALALGGSAWVLLDGPRATVLARALTALAVAVGSALFVWRRVSRVAFLSVASYQPTVQSLANRLATLRGRDQIHHELRQSIAGFLPEVEVEVVSAERAGEQLFRDASAGEGRQLLVAPMRSAGQVLGAVHVTRRPGSALFTSADVELLQVLATFGALALSSAEAIELLEQRRRFEAHASRDDTRLRMDTLAAEVAHELSYPLTYFRHFFRRLERRGETEAGELEIGLEEVARLERMLGSVRRLASHQPELQTVALEPVVRRAIALLEPELTAAGQTVQLDLLPLELRAAPDPLLQLFANLLRNASQAAGREGALGVRALHLGGDSVELAVWDDGDGVPDDLQGRLFDPFTTTKPEGTGLGLAICHRIARSFGWTIGMRREAGKTWFAVGATTAGGSS